MGAREVRIVEAGGGIEVGATDVPLGRHEEAPEDGRVKIPQPSPVVRRDVDVPEASALDDGHGSALRDPRVVGGRALDESAPALATGELPVPDDDRTSRQHDVARTLDLAPLVARVVDVHVVRL